MSNTFKFTDKLVEAVAVAFQNAGKHWNFADRRYEKKIVNSKERIGKKLRLRHPAQFILNDGVDATGNEQDITEIDTYLDLTERRHVLLALDSEEMTYDAGDIMNEYAIPIVEQFEAAVETELAKQYILGSRNVVGTPGANPATADVFQTASAALERLSVPENDIRGAFITPTAGASLATGNPSSAGSLPAYYDEQLARQLVRKSMLGEMANAITYKSNNLGSITAGTHDAAGAVSTAPSEGAAGDRTGTITLKEINAAAATIKAGEKFTIDGVYEINPVNREKTGELLTFTVTEDTAATAGVATVTVTPAFRPYDSSTIGVKQYANMDTLPIGDADITWLTGTESEVSKFGYMAAKRSMLMAMAPLLMPTVSGVDYSKASMVTKDGHGPIRMTSQYDILKDKNLIRFDILFGFHDLRPEWSCGLLCKG